MSKKADVITSTDIEPGVLADNLLRESEGTASPQSVDGSAETPKRKRGRPPGSGKKGRTARVTVNGGEPQSVPVETPQEREKRYEQQTAELAPLVQMCVGLPLSMVIKTAEYTQEHATQLTRAALPVLEQYDQGDRISKHAPLLMLAAVVIGQGVTFYRIWEHEQRAKAEGRQLELLHGANHDTPQA